MSTQPDLLYSEAEDDLRSAVRSLLTDRSDTASVLVRAESGTPYDPELWKALAGDMGAAGLLVPEKLGGQGASHREAAVVLEELGRSVAPAPYLTSSVIATETLLALDTESEPVAALLAELAAGRKVAVLAVPLSAAPDGPLAFGARRITGVPDAAAADVLLVLKSDGLYAVEAAGVTVEALTPLDLTRPLAAVTVDRTAAATRLADAATAEAAVRRGLLAGAGLLASEQLGLAEWCLEETVRHTRERHQFNRPIGSFQALKHRMAQLWLEVVSSRAAARAAADALATDSPEAALTVAVAQAYCSRVAVHAAEECVQLHAGIGMTWEHPAHLYLKRAKSDEIALGTPGRHKEALAELVDLRAP
ncbi:acyl-CoA/acyl-ACP dehydrogenase [Streptomyces lunaelactis]|uniref:acyl-CoA dehydrogenase family protein n=2 Tax=Streptomyces lunaelactis TaxID=1535768 RepID=UPI0015847C0D|nr:acyl-CoA dehydrogenase family protein [Streptomyces lunaelactis]NUK02707.1 acyl-CoA/acyl-ACP dehydrogenase [Streptomyces lunaelactis]NUK16747.1 acyl-CoA/acyl-ACP dehydrogenase [Streptomyces lunaelactis]NUK21550.1 acyl-CoA/acyl-ACP dehydrogenase [Streptomyces lunaelactis]NUK35748.1 acyl-CoA/acyl-ACP dehydrogenase [Streptomyces lunaelactis]NUK41362.1 acyl-CoA/acyl-ACP dehydrogenase [Streptomyces lunaelactis]